MRERQSSFPRADADQNVRDYRPSVCMQDGIARLVSSSKCRLEIANAHLHLMGDGVASLKLIRVTSRCNSPNVQNF